MKFRTIKTVTEQIQKIRDQKKEKKKNNKA